MEFDLIRLRTALKQIPTAAWSLPSSYVDTGVHHGYRRVVLVHAGQQWEFGHLFDFVWDELAPVWGATLSWIDSGGFIIPHRDAGPWRQRWHVPIIAAGQWCGAESFTPRSGIAFQVAHWEPHTVVNRSDHPRVHIVIDRDIPVDHDLLPFETFSIPENMTDLIEKTK